MSFFEDQVKRITEKYQKVETAIMQQLLQLESLPESDDKVKRLARIQEMQKQTQAELAKLNAYSKKWAEGAIGGMYKDGVKESQEQIKQATGNVFAGIGGFHADALALMADKTYSRFADVITTTGRKTLDVYNEAKLNVHLFDALAGSESAKMLNRRMIAELKAKGVTGFVDKSGRAWNMTVYTEMLARTSMMNAYREAKMNELRLCGYDFVRISSHGTICEKCKPWEGAVLSISGSSEKYPSMSEAEESGLFHPNCEHSFEGWFDLEDEDDESLPESIIDNATERSTGLASSKHANEADSGEHTKIASQEPFDINDEDAIEAVFKEFFQRSPELSVENAIIISPDGNRYDLEGGIANVDITVTGESALNGAKVIHNHPSKPGKTQESFSSDDFVAFHRWNLERLDVVFDGKRHRMEWIGEKLSGDEARTIYEMAEKFVQEEAMNNRVWIDDVQYETMLQLLKMPESKGLRFYEL